MKKEKQKTQWEISFGTYEGVLIGYRNYDDEFRNYIETKKVA